MSPFSHATLKETFAGDVLTSLSRVLTNGAYTTCYFASGVVILDPATEGYSLHNFGICTKNNALQILNAIFVVLPFFFRFMQCVRIIYEKTPSNDILYWPQSLNVVKYLLSIVVTLFQILKPLDFENHILVGFNISLLILLTFFTFFWDATIDWGLFQRSVVQKVKYVLQTIYFSIK
jgi:hypothetical protein